MAILKDCNTCDSCEEILEGLNTKLINIGDIRLYNTRYELNRKIDYELFSLLVFYKGVLEDICNEADCGCYTVPVVKALEVTYRVDPIDNVSPIYNHCVCGCCEPLNPVCTAQVPCPGLETAIETSRSLTTDNILERIRVLTI